MKKNGILFALVAIAALSAGAVDAAKSGALLLSFDDRNFGDWEGAIGLFDKYGARATFFCCGEIDTNAVRVLKKLQDRGHSIGLHGRGHLNANEAVAEKGADGYWADEIEPQLAECRTAGIKVASFAYPNCRLTIRNTCSTLLRTEDLRFSIASSQRIPL